MAILFVIAKPAIKVRSLMIMFSALVTEVPVVLVLKSRRWCRFCRAPQTLQATTEAKVVTARWLAVVDLAAAVAG
jgi:hypothetical protein